MNIIFWKEMDNFVIVYIDDILVCSKMGEEHAKQYKVMLKKLKNSKFY